MHYCTLRGGWAPRARGIMADPDPPPPFDVHARFEELMSALIGILHGPVDPVVALEAVCAHSLAAGLGLSCEGQSSAAGVCTLTPDALMSTFGGCTVDEWRSHLTAARGGLTGGHGRLETSLARRRAAMCAVLNALAAFVVLRRSDLDRSFSHGGRRREGSNDITVSHRSQNGERGVEGSHDVMVPHGSQNGESVVLSRAHRSQNGERGIEGSHDVMVSHGSRNGESVVLSRVQHGSQNGELLRTCAQRLASWIRTWVNREGVIGDPTPPERLSDLHPTLLGLLHPAILPPPDVHVVGECELVVSYITINTTDASRQSPYLLRRTWSTPKYHDLYTADERARRGELGIVNLRQETPTAASPPGDVDPDDSLAVGSSRILPVDTPTPTGSG